MKSLGQKIVAIMGEVNAVGQNGYNSNQKYKYTQAIDVIREVRQSLVTHKIRLKSEVLDRKREEKITVLTIKYSLIDIESGEVDSTTLIAEGMDGGDKAANKALTSGLKYFFRDTFLLEFADDPEQETSNPPNKQKQQYKSQQQKQPVHQKQQTQTAQQQPKQERNLNEWKELAGKQRKRFFAIANKKKLSDKQQKAIIYFYLQKASRADVTEREFEQINQVLEKATAEEIRQTVLAAVEKKQQGGAA
jgi:hypothetical protein